MNVTLPSGTKHRRLLNRIDVWQVVGLVASLFLGGCKQSWGETPKFTETSSVETVTLFHEPGGEPQLGERAIAATPVNDGLAILVDRGGPRYVAVDDTLVEVCSTAESIASRGKRIAVGCSALGIHEPTRVQFIEGGKVTRTVAFDVDPPSNMLFRWPVVDPKLELAAMPAGNQVVIASLDDASVQATIDVDENEGAILEFSPSSTWLAIGRSKGSVDLYDRKGVLIRTLEPPRSDRGPMVAFSPTEDRVAVASFWGQFRLYSIEGKLLARDSTKEGNYGFSDVAFVGDDIAQIEAGMLVFRNSNGRKYYGSSHKASVSKPFGPPDLGALNFVSSIGSDAIIVIGNHGQRTSVLSREIESHSVAP